MKKLFIVFWAAIFIVAAFTGSAFGMGEEFSAGGCSLTLVQHSAYTDKSTWKFNGSCTGGYTFELSGMWKLSEKKAYESIKGTGNASNVNGAIVAVCPMGIDPWLNVAACALQAQSGNFTTYYKIYPTTQYPLSANSLSASQKSVLRAEAQGNGPYPGTPPPPPPPDSNKKLLAAKTPSAVMILRAPKIEAPVAGMAYHSSVPVKVTPPVGVITSTKKVKLEFQYHQGASWVTKTVVAEYDTGVNPSGISIPKNQFPDKGDWRIKAKMASPVNAPWSNWVQFRLN